MAQGMGDRPYAAGLDFGTSGARIAILDGAEQVCFQSQVSFPKGVANWSAQWLTALDQLWQSVPIPMRQGLGAIALNGTSATVLLCDGEGHPLTEPLLYNDDRGKALLPSVEALAPPGNPVRSATSSLVKLLWWQHTLPPDIWQRAKYFLHQADWLAFHLHGHLGRSDYHNALKLGYDLDTLSYPPWLQSLENLPHLPQVQAPGTPVGTVTAAAQTRYGLPPHCTVVAGTTDSIAAFLASGATLPGDAVTSLGSTLVLKLLSTTRVDDHRYGIYSHRLGDRWLVGGASNTGGAVLRAFFTDAELVRLSEQIEADRPSGLSYYPLLKPGERFPINDPAYPPQLGPRPADPAQFLQGLFEGMARIEAQGYQLLQTLGATPPSRIFSAGGGAHNPTWSKIRQRYLPAPLCAARSTDAAIGTARLALGVLR